MQGCFYSQDAQVQKRNLKLPITKSTIRSQMQYQPIRDLLQKMIPKMTLAVKKEEITVENTFTDANDMFTSADFSGAVSGCTETTCTIDANFASTTDGEADSGSVSVTFTDETIFQRALVDSQGRKYYLDDGDKSELKDDDFVLLLEPSRQIALIWRIK